MEESLNEQVEKAIGDFQSSLNELKDKILDFDSLLELKMTQTYYGFG